MVKRYFTLKKFPLDSSEWVGLPISRINNAPNVRVQRYNIVFHVLTRSALTERVERGVVVNAASVDERIMPGLLNSNIRLDDERRSVAIISTRRDLTRTNSTKKGSQYYPVHMVPTQYAWRVRRSSD